MGILGKDEFSPLLPLGFHPMTLADVRGLCVNQFPMSVTRPAIMDGLEDVIGQLNGTGFQLEVWIDGSFVTQKFNPDDSDIVVLVSGEAFGAALPTQQAALHWFAASDLKPDFKSDCYIFPEYGNGHPLYDAGQWRRAYWLNKFGHSRAEEPKGLAVVNLPIMVGL